MKIQGGASCTTPIIPASSGSWRIGTQVDVDLLALQDHRGAADRQLAHPAAAHAAADHDALDLAPVLQLQQRAHHGGEGLGEFLDHAMHQAGGLGVAVGQQRVELLARDVLGRRVAQRVVLGAVADALAPVVQQRLEGAAAGTVAEEALRRAQLGVVAVEDHRRQRRRAVVLETGRGGVVGLFAHGTANASAGRSFSAALPAFSASG